MNFTEWAALAILSVFIIAILYIGFFPLIKKAVGPIMDFGGEEPEALTKLKADCEKYQEENDRRAEGCALEVAKAVLEAGENPLIAESWLRKEISFTNNNAVLQEAFEFAKEFYASSKIYGGGYETYNLFLGKLNNEIVQPEINYVTTMSIYQGANTISDSTQLRQFLTNNKEQLKYLLGQLKSSYKPETQDRNLLNDFGGCNILYSKLQKDSYLAKHPEDDVAPGRACSSLSRASIKYGCFLNKPGECISCYYYSLESLDPKIDICSGYKTVVSCEADSCNVNAVCRWEGTIGFGKCISKQTYLVQG